MATATSFQPFYDAWEAAHRVEHTELVPSIDALFNERIGANAHSGGFDRIARCRQALEALDLQGWERSYHQRQFHDTFIRACARVFWKTEKPGQFARDHQKILQLNGWDHLCQEILVSTPRRFGKTIGVSMFAAAMLYAAPNTEISIYSTCKRISQKLLRNVIKFLELIYVGLNVPRFRVIRENMEELVIRGPESMQDVRIVNSYPSKVWLSWPLIPSLRPRPWGAAFPPGLERQRHAHALGDGLGVVHDEVRARQDRVRRQVRGHDPDAPPVLGVERVRREPRAPQRLLALGGVLERLAHDARHARVAPQGLQARDPRGRAPALGEKRLQLVHRY